MPESSGNQRQLHPTQYLGAQLPSETAGPRALIVLNSPLEDYETFNRLYQHTSYRVYADGGANRVHRLLTTSFPQVRPDEAIRATLPDVIHGDLDSLDDVVRADYHGLGVEISQDPDQYSTDFGKGVKKILLNVPNVQEILVLGSIGGRVDQGIGLLHELYREQKFRHPGVKFWLFSEKSISIVLPPGVSMIETPLEDGVIEHNIGILPLYGKASITTRGLEWDVEDWPTELGGQLSTSNHIKAGQVLIKTDVDVLFTVERKTCG